MGLVFFGYRYNISPLSNFFCPEKLFFLIIIRKVIKSKILNIIRRKNLAATIFREGVEMRFYTNYIKAGERYITNRVYNKYASCIRIAKASCDLVISQKNWDKLDNKKIRLSKVIAVKRKEITIIFKEISRLKSL